jgi:hypothetical protein
MQCWSREPNLNEMMQDPIVKAVMLRDAVQEGDLRRLLARTRAAYAADADFLARGHLN